MTFGIGLSASLRALAAARYGIQTASQNVANANTPGYSRQRVSLSSTRPYSIGSGLQIGGGVQVTDIRRVVDQGLIHRIESQSSLFGHAEAHFSRLSEIEGLFIDGDGGVDTRLSDLFGSLGQLQTDPRSRALRSGVIQSAQGFTDTLRAIATRFDGVGDSTFEEVRGLARTVQQQAEQIARLNQEVVRRESGGGPANDMRDQRDQLVREMASLVELRTVERTSGALDVIVGGRLVVAGGRSEQLGATRDANGHTQLTIRNQTVDIDGGRIGALLNLDGEGLPAWSADLDRVAREMALQFNRIHTTGVPSTGPFSELVANTGARDTNGNGVLGDELLADSGLPFDIEAGALWVRVTNSSTGAVERSRIDIDPTTMTLRDLAAELSEVSNLSANVDARGRLRINADRDFGFDFGAALDTDPDDFGGFGGGRPVLGSAAEPLALNGTFPMTFDVDANGTIETVTLESVDFRNPGAPTAAELAAAISADLTAASAESVGGRVLIRGDDQGAAATLSLTDGSGSPLTQLGFATGPATGQDRAVTVEVSGRYAGSANDRFTFVPSGDGTIGVTDGLQVLVYDDAQNLVTTLDVGNGYDGDPIEVVDGIEVSFTSGTISGSANQAFAIDALADTDTSDLLVAIQMNALFTGSTARDLAVAADVLANADRFAASDGSADGDSSQLLRMIGLERAPVDGLGDADFEEFLGELVADIGFESASARATLETQESVMTWLEEQRLAVSGVDIDEEMLDIVAWQQTYEAASRIVGVVQSMTDTLMTMGRIR